MLKGITITQQLLNEVEIITSIITCLAGVATCATIIFLIIQSKLLKKQLNYSESEFITATEYKEREKAIELAMIYGTQIMDNMTQLTILFNLLGIEKIISKKLKTSHLKEFDIHELAELLTEGEVTKIRKKLKDVGFEAVYNCKNAVHKMSKEESSDRVLLMNLDSIKQKEKSIAQLIDSSKYDEHEVAHLELYYKISDSYYINNQLIYGTLNQLEAFSMYFNNGVADEEVVYQSLHQSFFATVKLLYIEIASKNQTGKDKYYTNIIQLYNRWNERYEKEVKKEVQLAREVPINPKKIKKPA